MSYLDPKDPRAERRSAGVILDDATARCGWDYESQVSVLLEYIDAQGKNAEFADFMAGRDDNCTECDECGAMIPDGEPDTMNAYHRPSCSLHQKTAEPAGPFYVVIDHEQTAAECPTLEAARIEGRKLADAEPIPCAFSIQDSNGQHVEDITRTDGRTLADQVQAFSAAHAKR